MRPSRPSPIEPCCTVSRHRLAVRAAERAEAMRDAEAELREQLRFERICARELLGETD